MSKSQKTKLRGNEALRAIAMHHVEAGAKYGPKANVADFTAGLIERYLFEVTNGKLPKPSSPADATSAEHLAAYLLERVVMGDAKRLREIAKAVESAHERAICERKTVVLNGKTYRIRGRILRFKPFFPERAEVIRQARLAGSVTVSASDLTAAVEQAAGCAPSNRHVRRLKRALGIPPAKRGRKRKDPGLA